MGDAGAAQRAQEQEGVGIPGRDRRGGRDAAARPRSRCASRPSASTEIRCGVPGNAVERGAWWRSRGARASQPKGRDQAGAAETSRRIIGRSGAEAKVALAGLGEKIALEHELGVEVVHQVTPHGKAAS